MRLRDLPTEDGAAQALLRTEQLAARRAGQHGRWYPYGLAGCAVALVTALLLPVSEPARCGLWRSGEAPVGSRTLALCVPLLIVVPVLLDRMLPGAPGKVRAWAVASIGGPTLLAWLALLGQARPGCSVAVPATGTLLFGGLATVLAGFWARRPPAEAEPLIGAELAGRDEPELNQPEIWAAFQALLELVRAAPRTVRPRLAPLAGCTAGLLLLSTVTPWRELVDPAALDPVGVTDRGLARLQAWEMSYLGAWPWAVAATALATVAVAVSTQVPLRPALARRIRSALLVAAAAGTGAVTLTGLFAAVLPTPARLPDGVGYRVSNGVWLTVGTGAVLLGLGIAGAVQAIRRRQSGWLRSGAVLTACAAGLAAGAFVPAPAAPAYQPDPAVAHPLLPVRGGQLTDRMGLRLAITAPDPLAALAPGLDGTPGWWLMARTDPDDSTVYQLAGGIALPRTVLRHSNRQPVLIGVSADRLLVLAGSAVVTDRPWALLAIPLRLRSADVSLEQRAANGELYLSPGVSQLAGGIGRIQARRTTEGSVLLWDDDETWRIPAHQLTGDQRLELKRFTAEPGAGAAGNPADFAPDGSAVWSAGRNAVFTATPGGTARLVTGTAPAGCSVSRDPRSSTVAPDRFAIDAQGNIWLAGAETGALVVPPDGPARPVPGIDGVVNAIEARPDGSVLFSVSPGGGDVVLEIAGAAGLAARFPLGPEPEPRCDQRRAVPGVFRFAATQPPQPRSVGTPVPEDGGTGLPSASSPYASQLMLDTGRVLVRRRLPEAVANWAPDNLGGVWWVGPPKRDASTQHLTAVHLPAGSHTATAIQHPEPLGTTAPFPSSAAYGDRFVCTLGGNRYGLFGPGKTTGTFVADGQRRAGGLALNRLGSVAAVLDGRLVSIEPSGAALPLFGGDQAEPWPLATGVATGVPPVSWSTDGQWFGGPDGRLWGYDGRYLYQVHSPGRVVVLGGEAEGVPSAADRVTVIGPDLYFEYGADVVRLTRRTT